MRAFFVSRKPSDVGLRTLTAFILIAVTCSARAQSFAGVQIDFTLLEASPVPIGGPVFWTLLALTLLSGAVKYSGALRTLFGIAAVGVVLSTVSPIRDAMAQSLSITPLQSSPTRAAWLGVGRYEFTNTNGVPIIVSRVSTQPTAGLGIVLNSSTCRQGEMVPSGGRCWVDVTVIFP